MKIDFAVSHRMAEAPQTPERQGDKTVTAPHHDIRTLAAHFALFPWLLL